MNVKYAPVAQLDRVSDSDSEGRAFESHQAYQEGASKTIACFLFLAVVLSALIFLCFFLK